MVHPPAPFWWGPLDLRAALSHGVLARAEGQPPRAELTQCPGGARPLPAAARGTLHPFPSPVLSFQISFLSQSSGAEQLPHAGGT